MPDVAVTDGPNQEYMGALEALEEDIEHNAPIEYDRESGWKGETVRYCVLEITLWSSPADFSSSWVSSILKRLSSAVVIQDITSVLITPFARLGPEVPRSGGTEELLTHGYP